MEQRIDLRVIKTRKGLTDAFWQMLAEKKFEDITVNELCDRAMVRRATFYKHFADKFDFFAFVVRGKLAEFDAQMGQPAANPRSERFILGVIQHTLDFLNSNKKLVQTVLESNMFPTVMDILSRQISADITQKLTNDARSGVPLSASPQVTAQFFTGALIYTMMWWVKQENVSEADLMKQLASLLRNF